MSVRITTNNNNDGCRFANSFCTSPVCTPSRGAMMTGRYPQTNGLMGLIQTPYRWRYNQGERHISHLLADNGYQTILFNHQHEAAPDDPLGFRERRLVDCGFKRLLTGERVSTAAQTAEAFADFVHERPADHRPFYAQNRYLMFLKDETNLPFTPQKNIRLAVSKQPEGPYSPVSAPITGDYWCEGPSAIKIGDIWFVYFDRYRDGRYGAVVSKDLCEWEDISDEVDFPDGARHGTVFPVSSAVLERLLEL